MEKDILIIMSISVRQIAFEAHPTKDYDVSSTEYTQVTFDKIVLNKGQAYDPESGVFTAPLSGLYYIQVHVFLPLGTSLGSFRENNLGLF